MNSNGIHDTWPLVSVVVPVYNGDRYIGACLQSILQQDYPALELIVVDDGSTDETESRVRAFGSAVVYVRQENSGSAVARNQGVQMARGEYIAFNDGDDLWAPHRLKQQLRFLRGQTEYQAVCGRFMAVPDEFTLADAAQQEYRSDIVVDPTKSGWTYLRLLETSIYHIDTVLVTKAAMSTIRFNPDYRRGQDFDFWLQLLHVTPIAQLDNLYAFYRQNPTSITRKPHVRNYRAEILKAALQKYGSKDQLGREISTRRLNEIQSISWFGHGYELFRAKWFRKASESFLKCLRFNPRNLGAYKYLLLCYLMFSQDKAPPNVVGR